MSGNSLIYIIGDIFFSAAELNNIITFKNFIANQESLLTSSKEFIFGQGLTTKQIKLLISIISLNKQKFCVKPVCKKQFVHKQRSANVLITNPDCINNKYIASLRIHPKNELLQDHISGKHLPGMLLLEAARQFGLAIYQKKFSMEKKALVLSLSSEFKALVFPLPCDITGQVDFKKDSDKDYLKYRIIFSQLNKECAIVEIEAIFIDEIVLLNKEKYIIKQ